MILFYVLIILFALYRQFFRLNYVPMTLIQIAFALLSLTLAGTIFFIFSILNANIGFEKIVNEYLNNNINLNFYVVSGKEIELGGLLVFCYNLTAIVFGVPFPIVMWFFELEPLSTALRDVLVGDPIYYSMLTCVILSTVTLVVFSWVFYILLRSLGVIFIISVNVVSCTLAHILTIQYYKVHNDKQPILRYNYANLLHKQIDSMIARIALVFIVGSQFCQVEIAWLLISCFARLPKLVVGAFAASFVIFSELTFYFYGISALIRITSLDIIRSKSKRTHRNSDSGYWRRKWTSLKPVSIKCGERFTIMEDSVMIHLRLLTDNIANSVLLISV